MMTHLLVGLTLALGQTGPVMPPAAPSPYVSDTSAITRADPPSAAAPPTTPNSSPPATPAANGCKDKDEPKEPAKDKDEPKEWEPCFCKRVFKTYYKAFTGKKEEPAEPDPEAPRRAPPSPFNDPPFPVSEYQGYPLIGVPAEFIDKYPLMQGLLGIPCVGDFLKDNKIAIYGWVTVEGNFSKDKNSNAPESYWIRPNKLDMDQAVLRFERQLDSVQTDHIDYGFRSSFLYGIDYRYMTAGGYFSDQLINNNRLYGFDPTEQYVDVYIPKVVDGLIVRVGRWIACPDIETQFAPDNYMGSHSILFTFDTYTQTGVMFTLKVNDQWMLQAGMNAGNDMAPWYKGAVPCGYAGVRWTSKDNKDAMYTVLNQIDDAEFSHGYLDGQPAGHDNFNYIVSTWEHVFSKDLHTKTEGYFMWQRDAFTAGTVSIGPVQTFGGGGGAGTLLPGWSHAYGLLNYTAYAVGKNDYFTLRNEVWEDDRGMRSGFPGLYTSHAIGLSHNFNELFQVRPEFGYYRNWETPAFDNGTKKGMWLAGADMTIRF